MEKGNAKKELNPKEGGMVKVAGEGGAAQAGSLRGMTTDKAKEMGRAAYFAGKICAPAADKDFCDLLYAGSGRPHKQVISILKAWQEGWTMEHLRAVELA